MPGLLLLGDLDLVAPNRDGGARVASFGGVALSRASLCSRHPALKTAARRHVAPDRSTEGRGRSQLIVRYVRLKETPIASQLSSVIVNVLCNFGAFAELGPLSCPGGVVLVVDLEVA